MENLLSVGIDLGTTTTKTVFSRLYIDDTAGSSSIPSVSIIKKEILYRGPVRFTPMKSGIQIDADMAVRLIQADYENAGILQKEVKSGAVIITGEAARKENAAAVAEKLSQLAGDFVVATAGSDLESIIAGKGSGADAHSRNGYITANLDIGGGTSNIALFHMGEPSAVGSLDIGGRAVRFEGNEISYVSPAAVRIAQWCGADVKHGNKIELYEITKLAEGMAKLLEQFLMLSPRTDLYNEIMTRHASDFKPELPIEALSFSGGVADIIYNDEPDPFKYGDIGVFLARAILNSRLMEIRSARPKETIRATVIGAGTCSTLISGSTISFDAELLPLKNIPVLRLTEEDEQLLYKGDNHLLKEKFAWFTGQHESLYIALAFSGERNPSYDRIKSLAQSLSGVLNELIVLIIEHDMAKVLGQVLRQLGHRNLVVIDSIHADTYDHIDIGYPLMGGLAVPVIVKTLLFG